MVPVVVSIPLIPVESSNIEGIGYDAAQRTLAIKFKSGSLFHYREVPVALYNFLKDAKSKGQYFHQTIRGKFESQAVVERREAECPACGDHGSHGCVCDCCGCANYSEAFQ